MDENSDLIALTIDVVSAFVGQNNMRPEDVPAFIANTHAAITQLKTAGAGSAGDESKAEYVPAVSVRKSLASKDHILSMIDGKPYKTLRRHLTKHGLTPDQYRARYKLPDSYPMVAESYSAHRRELANKSGLGKKIVPLSGRASPAAAAEPAKAVATAAKPKGRGRKSANGVAAPAAAAPAPATAKKGRPPKAAAPAPTAKRGRKAKAQPAAAAEGSAKSAPAPKKRLSLKLAATSAEKGPSA